MSDTTPVAALLPHVARDVPAAVLLVDLSTARVLYAGHVATQLAPHLQLPFTVADWSAAAGLQDDDGQPLDPDGAILAGLSSGSPNCYAMTAQRSSDISSRREMLWATAVPLNDAPGLSATALLVFLPLRNIDAAEATTGAAVAALESENSVRHRAVLATGLSFTVADARQPDKPLIWVNPAFTAATGYSYDDAVGRNCRFLQGPDTDPETVDAIRTAVVAGDEIVTTLLNYRKDGTPFWNQLAINPVRDADGTLTHYVGIQTDVTQQRLVEDQRAQALAAERRARRAAELAQAAAERSYAEAQESRARLQLLAEASTALASTLDFDDTFVRLVRIVLPRLADWMLLDILGEDGLKQQVLVRHRDGLGNLCRQMSELHAAGGLTSFSLTQRVLETGRPQLRTRYDDAAVDAAIADPELREVVQQLGLHSALAVPLRARARLLGVMTFVSGRSGREYDEDDLRVVADLGRRAALTLDNARLYSIEHATAETLQRSLLPDIPDVAGVESAARYLAGHTSASVGGDFYELLALPDGAIGFAIGDVVGHDMTAAAAMGHLRGLLRACAWDDAAGPADADGGAPGKVMARVDRLVQVLHVAPLATVFYARLECVGTAHAEAAAGDPTSLGGPSWQLRWSNAGHPPPMILRPDGTVDVLDEPTGMLLGVEQGTRDTAVTAIEPGSILFGYTDGLIERRGADIDAGIAWLRSVLEGAPAGVTPSQLCDLALGELSSVDDDIAILAVRITP